MPVPTFRGTTHFTCLALAGLVYALTGPEKPAPEPAEPAAASVVPSAAPAAPSPAPKPAGH